MENLNAEREQKTNSNNELSSVYSYNELCEYLKRINVAANYKGNGEHENVPIILREFMKGYEQKIKELTEENEALSQALMRANNQASELQIQKQKLTADIKVLDTEKDNYKEWYFQAVSEVNELTEELERVKVMLEEL